MKGLLWFTLLLIKYVINSKGACSIQDRQCIAQSVRATYNSGDEARMRLKEFGNQLDDGGDQGDHGGDEFDFLFRHDVLRLIKPARDGQQKSRLGAAWGVGAGTAPTVKT